MPLSIDEQNEIIIKSRFGLNRITLDHQEKITDVRLHDEMVENVRKHRMINGITSKFSLMRNFLKTKKYVRTIHII